MNKTFACLVALMAAVVPSLSGQIVQGLVVDSLWQAPLPGAAVALLDAEGSAVARAESDEDGVFALRAPAAGQYRVRVGKEGFRTSTFPPFDLGPDERKAFQLLTAPLGYPFDPSPMTADAFMDGLCPEGVAPRGDRAILGVVYDTDQMPVPQAAIQVSWPSLPESVAWRDENPDASAVIVTDSSGFYVACGVPIRTRIRIATSREGSVSDLVELRFDSVETRSNGTPVAMPFSIWRQDFELLAPGERSATVRGLVRDGETGDPFAGATVELSGTRLTGTSGEDGTFVLASLPAGPARLLIRAPGRRPLEEDVTLVRDDTVSLNNLRLGGAVAELPPISVEAEAPKTRRDLSDFLERRAGGGGAFMTREEFEKSHPRVPTDVLKRMRGVRVYPNSAYATTGQHWVVSMSRTRSRSMTVNNCPPLYFLDRQFIGNANNVDIDAAVNLDEIQGIEAYTSSATLPQEFNRTGSACGVIAIWTR